MKLDIKQQVLLAIYTEYQKDIPNMANAINFNVIGIDKDAFKFAILKLQNERLISCAGLTADGNSYIPAAVLTSGIMMTREGIDYVEEKLDIKPTMTSEEKMKKIIENTAAWGFEQLKDIAAKTLADIIKSKI